MKSYFILLHEDTLLLLSCQSPIRGHWFDQSFLRNTTLTLDVYPTIDQTKTQLNQSFQRASGSIPITTLLTGIQGPLRVWREEMSGEPDFLLSTEWPRRNERAKSFHASDECYHFRILPFNFSDLPLYFLGKNLLLILPF